MSEGVLKVFMTSSEYKEIELNMHTYDAPEAGTVQI